MTKAIVLDIGGVLLRTEDRTSRQKLEIKYRLPSGGADELVFNSSAAQASTIGQIGIQAIWQNVADQLGLSDKTLETFKRAFWAGDQVDEDLLQFLQTCRRKYTTALLSNAWVNARAIFAEEYGIREGQTADYILISSELGVAKPDNRIYEILAETLNLDFQEILFVDDFIENVEAAKSLGIQTIHYLPPMDLISEIKLRLNHK